MKQVVIIFLVFVFALCHCKNLKNRKYVKKVQDPDIFRNVTGLITSKGYPEEDHTVQTVDGFILTMQRIPHGRKGRFQETKKKVVLLQHGLLSSSADWVINFPNESLGFMLADAGYDVWLGNSRGNTYSRRHIKYTDKQQEFWDFSFDQMAQYDLPAMIDYVLNVTGEEKLYYVGHSQGTTQAFALFSERPEYNKKVKLFVALAPVATVGYMTSVISYLTPFTKDINFLFELLGVKDFLPSNSLMKVLSEIVCQTQAKFLCEDVIFVLCGADKYQMNQTRVGVYTSHSPAGTSVKSIIHYAQMVNSKLFTRYDFGEKGNMEHYNQTTPLEYDVTRITTPVALLYATNDKLADLKDVSLLHGKLKSMVYSYLVPFPQFSHIDFVYGMYANKLVYSQVLTLLTHY